MSSLECPRDRSREGDAPQPGRLEQLALFPSTAGGFRLRTVRSVRSGQKEVERAANKQRGGFYTPPVLASWCVAWAVERGARVLEPSAGDGVFVRESSVKSGGGGSVVGIELDHGEAEKIRALSLDNVQIHTGDVFSWYRPEGMDGAFDAVVGNPPFIRYQSFPEEHREPAFALMREEEIGRAHV